MGHVYKVTCVTTLMPTAIVTNQWLTVSLEIRGAGGDHDWEFWTTLS